MKYFQGLGGVAQGTVVQRRGYQDPDDDAVLWIFKGSSLMIAVAIDRRE